MSEIITFVNAAVILIGAIGGVVLWGTNKRKGQAEAGESEASAAEVITEAAKKLIEPLSEKIDELERTNARLEEEVRELRTRVEQFARDEVTYQAELHAKNVEIGVLQAELSEAREERDELRGRVTHLEDVCKRAGINGD